MPPSIGSVRTRTPFGPEASQIQQWWPRRRGSPGPGARWRRRSTCWGAGAHLGSTRAPEPSGTRYSGWPSGNLRVPQADHSGRGSGTGPPSRASVRSGRSRRDAPRKHRPPMNVPREVQVALRRSPSARTLEAMAEEPSRPNPPWSVAHLGPRQVTRYQEANRSEGVGPPDGMVDRMWLSRRHGKRVAGADVEEERAQALDDSGQPVDATDVDRDERVRSSLEADQSRLVDASHFGVLQESGRGEEQGTDEVEEVVRARPECRCHWRDGGDCEAGRSDGKEDGKPPTERTRCPPGLFGRVPALLTSRARLPHLLGSVDEADHSAGGERTEAAGVDRCPAGGCRLFGVRVQRATGRSTVGTSSGSLAEWRHAEGTRIASKPRPTARPMESIRMF